MDSSRGVRLSPRAEGPYFTLEDTLRAMLRDTCAAICRLHVSTSSWLSDPDAEAAAVGVPPGRGLCSVLLVLVGGGLVLLPCGCTSHAPPSSSRGVGTARRGPAGRRGLGLSGWSPAAPAITPSPSISIATPGATTSMLSLHTLPLPSELSSPDPSAAAAAVAGAPACSAAAAAPAAAAPARAAAPAGPPAAAAAAPFPYRGLDVPGTVAEPIAIAVSGMALPPTAAQQYLQRVAFAGISEAHLQQAGTKHTGGGLIRLCSPLYSPYYYACYREGGVLTTELA